MHSIDCTETSLKEIKGVSSVHDVHIWSHNQGKAFMTAHLVVPTGPSHETLCEAQDLLAKRFHIHHSTIQIEQTDLHDDCKHQ
jgi:cobalt-zinc-cadmium efflux system protein